MLLAFTGWKKKIVKVRINTDKVRINTERLNAVQKQIVEFLIENERITNKQVRELLGVKDSRALKILKELVDMEFVVKCGKLKGSYYVLKEK